MPSPNPTGRRDLSRGEPSGSAGQPEREYDFDLVRGSDAAFGWDTGWDDPAVGMMIEPLQEADSVRAGFEHHIRNGLSSRVGDARMVVGSAATAIKERLHARIDSVYASVDGLLAEIERSIAGKMGQAIEFTQQLPSPVPIPYAGVFDPRGGGAREPPQPPLIWPHPIVLPPPVMPPALGGPGVPGLPPGVPMPPGGRPIDIPPGWQPGDDWPGTMPFPPGWLPPPGFVPPGWGRGGGNGGGGGGGGGGPPVSPPGPPGGPPGRPPAGGGRLCPDGTHAVQGPGNTWRCVPNDPPPDPPPPPPRPRPPAPPRPPSMDPPPMPPDGPGWGPPQGPGWGRIPPGGFPGEPDTCPPCPKEDCWYDYRDPCNCGECEPSEKGEGGWACPDDGIPCGPDHPRGRPISGPQPLQTQGPDDAIHQNGQADLPDDVLGPWQTKPTDVCTPAERRDKLRNAWRLYQSMTTGERYSVAPGGSPRDPADFLLYAGDSKSCVEGQEPEPKPPGPPKPPKPKPPPIVPPGSGFLDMICEALKTITSGPPTEDAITLSEALGIRASDPSFLDSFIGRLPIVGLPTQMVRVAMQVLAAALDGAEAIMRSQLADLSCLSGPNVAVHVSKIALGFLQKYISDDFGQVKTTLDYTANYICSLGLPTADMATNAWLRNAITKEQLECLVKMNGQAWEPYQPMLEAARTRAPVTDQVALWRRQFIDDDEFNIRMREHGFIRDEDVDEAKELSIQIPPVSELLRMMLRDVADETNIDWATSDALFEAKFTGQLKDWAYSQGIEDEFAKFVWRAHWFLPSPTQLFEMLHRLRHAPGFGGPAQFEQKIRGALLQQDIHPDWVDYLMRISYRPLTRVDTRRAYDIGVLGRDDVLQSYRDLGYADENAETLTAFAEQLKANRFKGHAAAKGWAAAELSRDEAERILRAAGATDEMMPSIMDGARTERQKRIRRRCLSGYRRRYLAGEFDRGEAVGSVVGLGLDTVQAQSEVDSWDCERKALPKHATASMLCGWLEKGLIGVVDFVDRLKNQGWSHDDALKIVRRCSIRITEAERAKVEADERKRQAELEKDERERKRLQKEADAAAEKARKAAEAAAEKQRQQFERLRAQQEKAQQAALKARERRQDSMLEIAAELLERGAESMGEATRAVTSAVASVSARPTVTIDEAIEVVSQAVEAVPKGRPQEFPRLVEEFATAAENIERAT